MKWGIRVRASQEPVSREIWMCYKYHKFLSEYNGVTVSANVDECVENGDDDK